MFEVVWLALHSSLEMDGSSLSSLSTSLRLIDWHLLDLSKFSLLILSMKFELVTQPS